jgi:flagellar biosynthesis protein FlhB
VSRLLTGLASLAAGGAAAILALPAALRDLSTATRRALLVLPVEAAPVLGAILDAVGMLARVSLPPCAAAFAAALVVGGLQAGFLFAPGALAWRWSRLDPAAWLPRTLSFGALGRGSVAIALPPISLAVAAAAVAPHVRALGQAARAVPPAAARVAAEVVRASAAAVAGLLLAAAVAELLLVRVRHLRRLRMTRVEVERDHREDEGDPRLRAERRRLHQRALAAAPRRATCLVVNPTHLAVALHHRPADDDAPVVGAKGAGARAVALRREARRLGIPVVHDPPLARALYRLADVGDQIPEELFEAAAAVLAHVHALRQEGRA